MTARVRSGEPPTVSVIQPYVPDYRVPFFDELDRQLSQHGLRLRVVHANPTGEAERAASHVGPWSRVVRTRQWASAGVRLSWTSAVGSARASDVVIAPLASTRIESYLLSLWPRQRFMLWGHGKSYVEKPRKLDIRLERWLARRAERVFVYTQSGASALHAQGYPLDRITVVNNSTDTVTLRALQSSLTSQEIDRFREMLNLNSGPIAAFVGAFTEEKLIPFLLESADLIRRDIPGFQLIMAGDGPVNPFVGKALQTRPWLHVLPRTDQATLACIGRISDCILMPGRVGLVAVDALALGLPLVTTTYPFHAPERDYLTDEVAVVSALETKDFATATTRLLQDPQRRDKLSNAARAAGEELTVQAMANAFVTAILDDTKTGP